MLKNLIARHKLALIVVGLMLFQHSSIAAPTPLAPSADFHGRELQKSIIWPSDEGTNPSAARFVAFRKHFTLADPKTAIVRMFADLRYLCWINGEYVARGPARFNPIGPEYDVVDISAHLHSGDNVIAIVVMTDASNGKMMKHRAGLTAAVEVTNASGSKTTVATNESWKWTNRTRYRPAEVNWGNVGDRIDSTIEDGDWTKPEYVDSNWTPAAHVDGQGWGPLTQRRIPMLRETPLEAKPTSGQSLPVVLTAGQQITFDVGRMSQAYTTLDLDATAGTTFNMSFPGVSYTYVAKAGPQSYISSDTCGMKTATFTVKSGTVTLKAFKPVECIYPFDCLGSFHSSDPLLDRTWAMCARSLQLLSEDAYVDCADRERTEWMDCDPPDFDITRTAMAAAGANGRTLYSDSRLLEEMVRRTALTIQPQGWVKAHTCSDRFDVHALMEDRSCDWVEGARRMYDSSGNPEPIREIWPVMVTQMKYFLDRRTERGLVNGRDWTYWRNPMGYVTCEAAALNAFVYRALVDAAYLGNAIGEKQQSREFDHAASELQTAFNKVLWDEKDGTYFSGYYTKGAKTKSDSDWFNKRSLNVTNGQVEPTMSPALIALHQGIVPDDKRAAVLRYLLAHRTEANDVMQFYYLFSQLYEADDYTLDREVLDIIRKKWKPMTDWGTSWEAFDGGSKAHCYGMFPGYFLSAYVLGVRPDGPVGKKHLLINPRLGDLTAARGKVVTEWGLVSVDWKMATDHLDFEFEIPDEVSATLRLPSYEGKATLVLDHQPSPPTVSVKAGHHEGTLRFPGGSNTFLPVPVKDFSDDFAHGNANWNEVAGKWKVGGGNYAQSDDSVVAVTGAKDASRSDATFEYLCQINKPEDMTSWAGFGFRKPSAESPHDDGGYLLYLRANGDLELFAGKVLQRVKTGCDTSKLVKLKIVAKSDHIRVFLNDELRMDLHDQTANSGFYGFETNHVQASFGPLLVSPAAAE